MNFSQARQHFYREVSQLDARIDVARAALYIAQEEYPDLDIEQYYRQLNTMADSVRAQLPDERYPLRIIQSINDYLFTQQGFSGNDEDYYDPRNSFLNQVLDRRTGIPLTLSVIYLEIAHRVDFPMVGVNMPGHFLIRPDGVDTDIWVDPFHQGDVLFREDCGALLAKLFDEPTDLPAACFEPISSRQLLARMLSNLKLIYLRDQDVDRALAAIERILLLFPEAPTEIRDRGVLYYHESRWIEARADLERYLELVPNCRDEAPIRALLDAIQS